jgi:hypothetical protein
MGCFDVVCSLTNTPIRAGQKCYLVTLRKNASWDTIVWLNSSEGRIAINRVFHGEYNDYGSLESEGLTEEENAALEKWEEEERRDCKSFFVSEEAWKWCQERYHDFIPYFVKERREFDAVMQQTYGRNSLGHVSEEKEKQDIEISRVLLAFASACKHPLSGLGQYHQYGGEEIQGIRENIELSLKRLKELEKWYKSLD